MKEEKVVKDLKERMSKRGCRKERGSKKMRNSMEGGRRRSEREEDEGGDGGGKG